MSSEKTIEKHRQRKKWSHIPYDHNDLPAIGLFFKKNYLGSGSYGSMSLFQWKIVDNYIRPGFINLIKDKSKITAITSLTPKSLVYKGIEIAAGEIGDTYVDRQYQRQGLFQIVGNSTRENATNAGIDFIYGLPNDLALPGWIKRANFQVMQNLFVRSLIFPVDIKPIVQKKSHWILGTIFGSIFSITSFLYFRVKTKFIFYDRTITIEEINQFPDDWGTFWSRAKTHYEFIIGRNKSAMEWRYIDNPNKYKFIFLRKNDALVGYLVYRIVHDDN